MKLMIYKGFEIAFLKEIDGTPLVEEDIDSKIDVLSFDKKTRKKLERALVDLEDSDEVWITYQEYSLIKSRVDDAIAYDDLEVIIYRNNLYPDYYPIEFNLTEELAAEIIRVLDAQELGSISVDCTKFLAIYNALVNIDGHFFGSFFNFEYERNEHIVVNDYYPLGKLYDDASENEFQVYLNEDIETYLCDLSNISVIMPESIGIRSAGGEVSNRLQRSLLAFCQHLGIKALKYSEQLEEDDRQDAELIRIAQEEIGIEGFSQFRAIPFYKNPDIDKEVVEISQGQIIKEIIRQAENAYADDKGKTFRDIFITASTGAGKSIMFQIPAVYLSKKYNKLTIIIEPVKALMQDQKEKLIKSGYTRVEAFNSDLITQVEKEAVLKRIRDGEVDLLYMSPETLLSYSIETIIGDREIGLLIVDEAHIVTTWGVGFRPDYWYLGSYINRLRHQIQTNRGIKRKTYHFPVCAFTATAINGGVDDSVGETIISLYMENPIKYIGYTKRADIKFNIDIRPKFKLSQAEYAARKAADLNAHIQKWIAAKEKTIVYFPYASLAYDAKKGVRSFVGITVNDSIGTYTGRNVDELSLECFNAQKRETFEKFREGITPVMYATKAFGMGVDVNDIKNVYHYATTGNLCDYVQEIGRVARKKSMTGYAITDFYYNDLSYMKVLFGMSQIKQYQIKNVLEIIYEIHKSKNYSRSFLISPESFTYIFGGDNSSCVNQLKTCLLMLEKDFYDKYNYKVLVSRPQSVFTKAYVVIQREHLQDVLSSKFGCCFTYIQKGRYNEPQKDGSILSDAGDIYSVDLKRIWEEFHPNISFPQFKYWYFNKQAAAKRNVEIMPGIRDYFSTRQKVSVEVCNEYLLCDIRNMILDDFEYISNTLYDNFRKQYFTLEEFAKLMGERYGMTKARMIANSLFDLVDPKETCVKHRTNAAIERNQYILSSGNFREHMRKPITKSKIMSNFSSIHGASFSSYISLINDEWSALALKLLSIFGYITYEIVGGEEPEIFIRLNDPTKIRGIVNGNVFYSNGYVTRARQKHDRDVAILSKFFTELEDDTERWDYIENYFLGYDVLVESEEVVESVEMRSLINKDYSYSTNAISRWSEIYSFFDEADHPFLKKLEEYGIQKPEYLETIIKNSNLGDYILMSWPSKNALICDHETPDSAMRYYAAMGWYAYKISEIDFDQLSNDIE
ncbi:MAG: DEAD/DEAH box helicase [Eubacteriales bacterium]|nr:DEAD/DEAH box helicase [Eubacteriales bacterium]